MREIVAAIVVVLLTSGCTVTREYSGLVQACNGQPLGSVEIEAWKNVVFSLPVRVAAVSAGQDGSFLFKTNHRVSFLTGALVINVDGYERLTVEACKND